MEQHIKEFEFLSELIDDLEREGITGIEKRRQIGNFLLRKSRLHGRPYCASFELTPLCNFDCRMCYMHLTKEQLAVEGKVLSTEEWLDIIKQSIDAGVASVDITGGECLMHPGFCDIYRYLINRGVNVAILTNGQLITDQIIQLFAQFPPSVVQISLYGSCSEAYMKVTGKAAFDDVMSSIHRLKAIGVRIKLSVTPNRFMEDDIEGILNLLHSLNVDYTIGSTTLSARPETGRNIQDYIIDNKAYVRMRQAEYKYRMQLINDLSLKPSHPYTFRIKGQETFVGSPCASGAANFHINWKGEMMPCIAFNSVTKSVPDSSVEEAWTFIREKMKEYRIPEECRTCELQAGCMGCPAEKTSGILNGPLNTLVCKRMHAELISSSIPYPSGNDCTL